MNRLRRRRQQCRSRPASRRRPEPMQPIPRHQPVRAKVHRLRQRTLPPIRIREPDLNMRKPLLNAADDRQLLAIQAVQAQNQRRIRQRPPAKLNHRLIRIIHFRTDEPQASQRRGWGRSTRGLTNDDRPPRRTSHWQANAGHFHSKSHNNTRHNSVTENRSYPTIGAIQSTNSRALSKGAKYTARDKRHKLCVFR